ncbi:aminotransferase class I/II-fold pyridoxal phosphate-dependent enzyme [bacterium]|nr:aminotransferase class I/II-fold pyridoxal phosphate-dependent enzyme [bacterium]
MQDTDSYLKIDLPPIASERMHRLPPYLFGKINARKLELRQQGVDVIDLGMGNPNDPTPDSIVKKLQEAATDKRNQRYSVSAGVRNLRCELARFYDRHFQVGLNADTEVIATIGSKEGFSHLCLATLGPGDVVLTPTPSFPIHIYAAVIAGANVIGVSQNEGEAQLLKNIAHTCENLFPRPKILMLNYPNNPTTMCVGTGFFKEVVALARKYGFYIIHDFAYGLTTFDQYRAPSILEVPGAKDLAVETMTLSKGYNMAGWRTGFVAGNADMIRVLASIKGYYDYGIFQAIQIASVIALREGDAFLNEQAKIYQDRRDFLCDGLNRIGWAVEKPMATMFVWARIPEKYSEEGSIAVSLKALEKAHVAISPGRGFGEDGEGFVRIALVENEQRLRQAVQQLKREFPQ